MPTVPRLTGPSVATAPLPGVRVAPTVAPALGPDLTAPLGAAAQLVQEAQARADQVKVNDADNQMTTARDRILYGDPQTPGSGLLAKQGEHAFGAAQDAIAQWDAAKQSIGATLNDRQRNNFQNRIAGYDHNLHLEIQSHVLAQSQRYDAETTDAYVSNRLNDASRSFANPKAVDTNIALAKAALADHAAHAGMPPELLQERQQKATSAARLSVVQQMLVASEAQGGGDLRASAYLGEHRGEFTARDLAEADRLTDAGSVRGESQRTADSILKSATTLSDALGKAASTSDPQVREATERRVRQHFADMAASDRDARNGAFTRASQAIQQGATVDQLPLADRVLLSPDEYEQLDRVSQRIRNPVVATPPSYYQHWMNSASLNPQTQQQFLDHDFGADRAAGKISEQDFHHFTGLQLQLQNSGVRADQRDERAAAAQEARQYRTVETATLKALRAYGKSKAARDAAANPRTKADSAMASAQKWLGPLVPPPIPQAMIDSAANDPHYMDYLKFNGYDPAVMLAQPPARAAAQPPKAPGAPIIR